MMLLSTMPIAYRKILAGIPRLQNIDLRGILINKCEPLDTKSEVTFLMESIPGSPKCCNKAGHRKGMEESGIGESWVGQTKSH